MAIQTLPFGEKGDVKNLVFTILSKEYPLKIIELTNHIRKRYGKQVTFQAVRKACLLLVAEDILLRKEKTFEINKEWVLESKNTIDKLYEELNKDKSKMTQTDSIEGDVSVFSFNSLNDMMIFWQNYLDNWFNKFRKGQPNINVYQAAHAWEALLYPDREKKLMNQSNKKGIKSYIVCTGNTTLDRNIRKFYNDIGVKFFLNPSTSHFDKGDYVGTYGEIIIQSQYPPKLVRELDSFFKKNQTLKKLSLGDLSEIVNKKTKIKLTIIKNLSMAKQINRSILADTI